MQELYETMLARLRNSGIPEVYPAYDAVPLDRKSSALFAVLSQQSLLFGDAYPVKQGAVYPFTADFRVDLLTPMTADPQDTVKYFFTRIVPAMLGSDCLFLRFDAQCPKVDLKLGRMVFGGVFRLCGAFCVTETEESA